MMSKNRNRNRLHVVTNNPVEEEKTAGVNVKQLMVIGAVTALTGTVVGAMASELYRYFRQKVPIPQPGQQPMFGQPPMQQMGPQQNPSMPWMTQIPQPSFQPMAFMQPPQPQPQYAIHQIGAFPTQPTIPNTAPLYALPSAEPPASFAREHEPLSRPELAQWQRRLESWQRDMERRESFERRDPYDRDR